MTAPRPRGRAEVADDLRSLQLQLAGYDTAAGPAAGLSEDERAQRLAAAAAMTAPCSRCHIYEGPFTAPIQAALPVLTRARFNHLPHVQLQSCDACHAMTATSTKAEDVNLPGVGNCQSCHRPGRSQSDCSECHRYHPRSEPWPPI